ncbi:peptidase M23B [Clostridium sp. CAG:1193]|nr:peptidase M23B [Clostridium sp. CAG:1193]
MNYKNNKLSKFLFKLMILTILFLSTIILIKNNEKFKDWTYKNLLSNNISFSKINTFYNKHFKGVLPFDKYTNTSTVFNEKLTYSNISKYNDGICLTVDTNYLVPIKYSGIVTFIGNKEGYGNTIIIESDDITVWYSNIDNYTVKLYDRVESGKYLGETIDDKLYLVFQKNGDIVDYKDYI